MDIFSEWKQTLSQLSIVSRSATYVMEELKRNDSSHGLIALLLSVSLL